MATPHKNDWVKSTPFGDYRDPSQNHKVVRTKQYYLVQYRRKHGFKHSGSKSMKVLCSM